MDHSLSFASGLLALAFLAPTSFAQNTAGERTPFEKGVPLVSASEPQPLEIPAGEHSFRVYEVGDLTGSQPAFPFDPSELATSDPELAAARLEQIADMETLRRQAASALESLTEVVKTYMEPELVVGNYELRTLGDNLLAVRASDAQHAWLIQFLETQRGITSWVQIKTRVWSGEVGFFEDFGLTREPQHLIDTRVDVEALIERAAGTDWEPVAVTQMTAYPRQEAQVSILKRQSYVTEWVLQLVEPNQKAILDPVLEVISEGVTVTARAVPLAPQHWSIDAKVHFVSVQKPVPTEQVQVGDGTYFAEISRPVTSEVKMHTRFSIPSGGGAVFLTYDSVEDRDILVLLQVEDFNPGDGFPAAAKGSENVRVGASDR